MKVGDKLICKKDYCTSVYYTKFYFYKGHIYEIVDIVDRFGYKILCIETCNQDIKFSLRCKDKLYVWDYFYTQEELRKIKLESI